MPSYIYECRACNEVFTQMRVVEERDTPTTCPKCGTSTTKRLVTKPIMIGKAKPPQRFSFSRGTAPGSSDRPGVTLENVIAEDCGGGVKLSGNARVLAKNVRLIKNRIGLDMDGNAVWDGEGPVVE